MVLAQTKVKPVPPAFPDKSKTVLYFIKEVMIFCLSFPSDLPSSFEIDIFLYFNIF